MADQGFPAHDGCPAESDGEHRWTADEPPEWMDTSEWSNGEWEDWYDAAARHCTSCHQSEED